MSSQKKQVVDLLKAIETGASEPVDVIDADPLHTTQSRRSRWTCGLRRVAGAAAERLGAVSTRRVFQDGPFVFAHTEYDFFGPKSASTFSGSRTEESSSIGTICRRRRDRTRAAAR